MVRLDSRPLSLQRRYDTLSYTLSPEDQRLYEATPTDMTETYNKARIPNRSAACLAMRVLQRRQASSTSALLRSLEGRLKRLEVIPVPRASLPRSKPTRVGSARTTGRSANGTTPRLRRLPCV